MEFENHLKAELWEELNPYEQDFKVLYLHSGKQNLSLPCSVGEIKELFAAISKEDYIYPRLFIEELEELNFFENGLDVSVYRHFRYLPPMWHQHTFFEVACVLRGHCTNYISEQVLPLTAGDICIIPPNTTHALSAFADDCIILNILLRTSTFEKTFLGDCSDTDILSGFFLQTLYHTRQNSYLLCRTHGNTDVLSYPVYACQEYKKNIRYKNRMLNSIITSFFISMLQHHEKDFLIPTENGAFADENLIFILRYMQENYNHIKMKELADFFNYSERHMLRILQTYTGMSFGENILKLKMKRSSELLAKSRMSIAGIAKEVGYSDVSNFRHAFKKYYAMAPVDYRSKCMENEMRESVPCRNI